MMWTPFWRHHKKNYTPGTLERKYAEAINKVINEFCMSYTSSIRRYTTCLPQMTSLFRDYQIKVFQDIPKSFFKRYKYSNINEICPFDEYVQKFEKIRNEYKKIDFELDTKRKVKYFLFNKIPNIIANVIIIKRGKVIWMKKKYL